MIATGVLEEGKAAALEALEAYLPERAADGTVLETRDVAVAFGGVQALRGVSIDVPPRCFVGLIGPNGAGKSTLFDVINGLTVPDRGEVILFGKDVTRMPPWDRAALGMSRTFQANHINLDLDAHDNLMAGAFTTIPGGVLASVVRTRSSRAGERRAVEAARAVARLLDLEPAGDLPARSLDFGAQRRIEIGRSLLSGPRLLLLDEPAAGLDPQEAYALFALVKQLQVDLGLAVLLVEHYVKAVLAYSDRVWVLDQGAVIAGGTPAEIEADPRVRATYLGEG
jgi:ABC-type branched-subunit amino acid transport system ATPase component